MMRALTEVRVARWITTLCGSTGRCLRRTSDAWPIRIAKGRLRADETGAAAVEFALVALPFLMLCLAMLQLLFLHYTQQTLSDALYASASSPEAELTTGNKSGYVSKLCNRILFSTNCLASNGVKVELIRLVDLPTTATAITGTTFNAGSPGDVLVLRAKMPAPQVVFFMPQLIASDSVIFRR